LVTTAVAATVSLTLIIFFAGLGLGALHPTVTDEMAATELSDQVQRLATIGRASLVLFLAALLVAVAGAVALVLAYERQASHLAHMVRRIAGAGDERA
jgi:hypothetical protein